MNRTAAHNRLRDKFKTAWDRTENMQNLGHDDFVQYLLGECEDLEAFVADVYAPSTVDPAVLPAMMVGQMLTGTADGSPVCETCGAPLHSAEDHQG